MTFIQWKLTKNLCLNLNSCLSIIYRISGTAIAVTVFSKYLKMHDTCLGIIATACKTVSSFVYGLAPTKQWFYSGPAFDLFGNSGVTAIRSLGTKVVDQENVGEVFLSLHNPTARAESTCVLSSWRVSSPIRNIKQMAFYGLFNCGTLSA